ncbi:MAG: VOC family protein [Nocardioides sp.]|uniref:VOC family protein n=1 Tax=Nocardioides sp. TaxID=35761 RepID=UPI0039E43CBC
MTTDSTQTPGQTPDETRTTGVTGEHTTAGVPHGLTALTPFLAIANAADALAFYRDVFGARVVDTTEAGGVVVHAELDFGNGHLQLGEPVADYHLVPAPDGEEDCYSLGLYCPDADALTQRAVAAGATVREPPTTFVSGDRFASIRDPYGVRWSLLTRVEDLSEAESAARVAEWARQFAGS